jgi:Ca2+-binding EF-hand superfamily protein
MLVDITTNVFKWVANNSKYDVNKDGVVNIYDLIIIGNNPDQSVPLPYPDYDVDENGKVDLNDFSEVLFYLKSLNI